MSAAPERLWAAKWASPYQGVWRTEPFVGGWLTGEQASVPYVRADLLDAALRERDEARAECDRMAVAAADAARGMVDALAAMRAERDEARAEVARLRSRSRAVDDAAASVLRICLAAGQASDALCELDMALATAPEDWAALTPAPKEEPHG